MRALGVGFWVHGLGCRPKFLQWEVNYLEVELKSQGFLGGVLGNSGCPDVVKSTIP